MKKLLANFLLLLTILPCSAQVWVLKSNHTMEMSTRDIMHDHATITIDSTDFIIRSGDKNYFYTILQQALTDDGYYYNLMDDDSNKAAGLLNPVQKILDFKFKGFTLQYQLDTITQPDKKRKDSIDRAHDTTKKAANADAWDTTSAKKASDSIYDAADQMPEYSGGDDAMKAFLQKNVKMPKAGVAAHAIGEVDVTAVVEKDGSLTHVLVEKDIGYNCGAEAVRVVKTMPKWLPGSKNGEPVRVKVTIPVMFLPPAK